jgi:hypothetical protein
MTIKTRVERLEERTTIVEPDVLLVRCNPLDGETLDQARERWLAEHDITRERLERFRYVFTVGF